MYSPTDLSKTCNHLTKASACSSMTPVGVLTCILKKKSGTPNHASSRLKSQKGLRVGLHIIAFCANDLSSCGMFIICTCARQYMFT